MERYRVLGMGGIILAVAVMCKGQEPSHCQVRTGPEILGSGQPVAPGFTTEKGVESKEKRIDDLLGDLDALQAQQDLLDVARQATGEQLKKKGPFQKHGGTVSRECVLQQNNSSVQAASCNDEESNPKDQLVVVCNQNLSWSGPPCPSYAAIPFFWFRVFVFRQSEKGSCFEDGASMVVDLYRGDTHLETWNIDETALKKGQRTDGFGPGYTLRLPWPNYSCTGGQGRLKIRYRSPQGADLEVLSNPIPLVGTKRQD